MESSAGEYSVDEDDQLQREDTLVDRGVDDVLDEGYSPPERPYGRGSMTFIVWGSARNQVDGYGNAVSPQIGEWIGIRLRAALHSEAAA